MDPIPLLTPPKLWGGGFTLLSALGSNQTTLLLTWMGSAIIEPEPLAFKISEGYGVWGELGCSLGVGRGSTMLTPPLSQLQGLPAPRFGALERALALHCIL